MIQFAPLFALVFGFAIHLSYANEPPKTASKDSPPSDQNEILCERIPTAYLVDQTLPNNPEQSPCAASAKIQGIGYDCGDAMYTFMHTQEYLKEENRRAREKCSQFCKSLNSKCTSHFTEQASCGFTIPTNRALDVGKKVVHCPKHCKGQAFNYCSLYHGNFFDVNTELFEKMQPNCLCQKKF